MCGIFGGYNISFEETQKGINLIKRGYSMMELQ